jgi:hypothetical protein
VSPQRAARLSQPRRHPSSPGDPANPATPEAVRVVQPTAVPLHAHALRCQDGCQRNDPCDEAGRQGPGVVPSAWLAVRAPNARLLEMRTAVRDRICTRREGERVRGRRRACMAGHGSRIAPTSDRCGRAPADAPRSWHGSTAARRYAGPCCCRHGVTACRGDVGTARARGGRCAGTALRGSAGTLARHTALRRYGIHWHGGTARRGGAGTACRAHGGPGAGRGHPAALDDTYASR